MSDIYTVCHPFISNPKFKFTWM